MTRKEELIKKISEAASKDELLSEEPQEPNLHLDLDEHRNFYNIQSLQQELRETKDTHTLRLAYTFRIFIIVCTWLALVIISVFLSGFKTLSFALSDKVLIVFITSTTVSVVGLFVIVAKWLFPINNPNSSRKQ